MVEVRPWFFKTPLLTKLSCATIYKQFESASEHVKREYGHNFCDSLVERTTAFTNSCLVISDVRVIVNSLVESVVAHDPDPIVVVAGKLHPFVAYMSDYHPRELHLWSMQLLQRLTIWQSK